MTTDKTGADVRVAENTEAARYDVFADGTAAGLTAFVDRESKGAAERIFYHTAVDAEFGGRGLATILIEQALADTEAQGKIIVGVCPLVAAYLKKHPQPEGTTRPVTPEVLQFLESRRG